MKYYINIYKTISIRRVVSEINTEWSRMIIDVGLLSALCLEYQIQFVTFASVKMILIISNTSRIIGQKEKWMNEPLHCVRMNMCTDERAYGWTRHLEWSSLIPNLRYLFLIPGPRNQALSHARHSSPSLYYRPIYWKQIVSHWWLAFGRLGMKQTLGIITI